MNLLKKIILLPVPTLESYAVADGELNLKGRRLARNMALLSIVFLVTDWILAMIRFGNFGLQSGWYYVVSIVCIGLIMMFVRKDAEKSIKEMKDSSNLFVKGSIYTVFGVVLVFEFVAKLIAPFFETSDQTVTDDSHIVQYDAVQPMADAFKAYQEMDDFMSDISYEPPKGIH